MAAEIEISTLDLQYQSYRMRNAAIESRLLDSIAQRGIETPLEGVDIGPRRALLNGFKRYRCARKLGIALVPYVSLGEDEALGIMHLLRVSNNKALSILEQARFVEDLKTTHGMSVARIAEDLCRSKAWVSMRLGLLGQMTETAPRHLFSGAFPVYSYMYLLRPFMRMNGVDKTQIEPFVVALSGKNRSVRVRHRRHQLPRPTAMQPLHLHIRGPPQPGLAGIARRPRPSNLLRLRRRSRRRQQRKSHDRPISIRQTPPTRKPRLE